MKLERQPSACRGNLPSLRLEARFFVKVQNDKFSVSSVVNRVTLSATILLFNSCPHHHTLTDTLKMFISHAYIYL